MFSALSLILALAASGASESEAAAAPDAAPPPEPAAALQDQEDLGKWKGSVTVGALLAEGNTDLTSLNAGGDAKLRREQDRISLAAFWNYQQEKGQPISQRKSGGSAKYDYFLGERTYAFGQTSAEADLQADLDLRFIIGGGIGHQFIEKDALALSAEAGLALFREEFGSSPDSEYLSARGAYDIEWQPRKDLQLLQSGVIYPSVEDSDDVYAKLDTRARLTLTENMFAQLQWVFDWDNTPAAGKERRDNRYLLSVGWSF